MNNGRFILRQESTRSQGIKIVFELTNLCNFSCIHCIRNEEGLKNYLSPDVIRKVLDEVAAYQSVNLVAFTGGEPTLHPRFGEIAAMVVAYGYSFSFVTNGWQYQKTFAQLKAIKNHIRFVNFSIDGASEETHDAIRMRKGSFRKLMAAMTLYRFNNVPFHINMVVTRTNVHEIEAMAQLASRMGCQGLGYAHCQPTPDAVAADMVMNAAERRSVENEIAELQRIYNMPIYLAGDHFNQAPFFQCSQLQMREFNIDYRGFLTACCTLSNYRGGLADSDVVADLNEVTFYEAHQRLLAKIAEVNAEKIRRIASGPLAEAEKFICTQCLLHYRKVPGLSVLLQPETAVKKT